MKNKNTKNFGHNLIVNVFNFFYLFMAIQNSIVGTNAISIWHIFHWDKFELQIELIAPEHADSLTCLVSLYNASLMTHTPFLTFKEWRTRNRPTASLYLISSIFHSPDYPLSVPTLPSFLPIPPSTPSFFPLYFTSNCPINPWSRLIVGHFPH